MRGDDGQGPPAVLPPPVLIGGVGRSGTSLLLRLLDGHPDLAVLPDESQLYRTMIDRFLPRQLVRVAELFDRFGLAERMADPLFAPFSFRGRGAVRSRLRRWARDFPDPPADVDRLIDAALGRADDPGGFWVAALTLYERLTGSAVAGKRYWVEKTPGNERLVGLTERLFGRSGRYLHVVRDPRDVIASRFALTPVRGAARGRALLELCVTWSRSLRWGRYNAASCPGRHRLLRYEDLTARTDEEMTGVAEFLGIPMHDGLLRPTVLGRPVPSNSSFSDLEGGSGAVVRSRPRFERVLSPAEAACVEALLQPQMRELGYRCEAPPPDAGDRPLERFRLPARVGLRGSLKVRELRRLAASR